jgi:hypothetical protein
VAVSPMDVMALRKMESKAYPDTCLQKEDPNQRPKVHIRSVERKDTLKKHNPIKRHVANTNPNLYPNLNVHVAHFLNLI